MPLIAYEAWRPGPDALSVIEHANTICADYAQQGYDLTLRQLYYRFVAGGLIPNTQQSYKRLGDIINQARKAGLLDWNYIVDRTRNLRSNAHWNTPGDIVSGAARQFALDKWRTQRVRVEVWVEKEALAGVVARTADGLDCAWFSCRGYVSQSELWVAARRHLRYLADGQRVVVVHLGDHDPSGVDMTRDIRDRLLGFVVQDWRTDYLAGDEDPDDVLDAMRTYLDTYDDPITVNRIALNMDQIEAYNPPPNPAKITDSRARGYIERYGHDSWELDALDPATLNTLIEDAIRDELDGDAYDELSAEEERQREVLTAASRRWTEVAEFLAANDAGA